MTARRFGWWLSRVLLALVLLVCAALLAVFSFEQYTLRPLIELVVENATGRAFSIEGELDARAGRIVSIRARGINLANAEWGSSENLLSIDEAIISVDPLRLFDTVPSIDKLVVSGARLVFEQDAQGRSNWAMAAGDGQSPSTTAERGGIALPILHSQLSDIDITVMSPALARPLELRLDSVEQSVEHDELRVTVAGAVDDRALNIQARIGPLAQLLDAGAVDFDVTADYEAVALEADGHLDRLLEVSRASVHVAMTSPDISPLLATLGLPRIGAGAAQFEANLVPSGDHHELDLTASIDSLKLDAKARLQALNSIDGASLTLSAGGPDLAAAARLAGLGGLPSQAFTLESSLALAGEQLTIGETRFDTGDSHLTAKGVMRQFPRLEGTDLELRLGGKNYLEFAELLGVSAPAKLQPEPFELLGKLEYSARDRQQFSAQLTLADLSGEFSGKLTEYPALIGSRLDYRLEGRNDALLQRVLGRPTQIAGTYSLVGNLQRTRTGFSIEAAALSLGANQLELAGTIGEDPLRADTELSVRFRGPDLVKIAAVAGYSGFLPAGDADISANARARDNAIHVDDFTAQIGRNSLEASGLISLRAAADASRAQIALAGEDIAEILPPDFLEYVDPRQSFELSATLALDGGQLAISALQAKLGEASLQASGRVSATRPLSDMSLQLDARGPDLAAIVPRQLVPYSLPAAGFSVSGAVALTEKALTLDGVDALVGADRLALSATIPLDTPSDGLNLVIRASGPSLGATVPAEFDQLEFPELAYEIDADIELAKGVLSLRKLDFSTPRGRLSGELSVSLENPRDLGRFDLRAKGDNLAEFSPSIPDFSPASVPFDLDARGSWDSERIRIETGKLKLDDASIEAQGEVDLPPNMVATRMLLSAHGDNLADLGQIRGLVLPPHEFRFDAALQGDARGLKIPQLNARLGESDMSGSIKIEFAEKPQVEIDLVSGLLDLKKLELPEDSQAEIEASAQPASSDGRLIPQLQVPVDQFHRVDLEARVKLGELRLVHNRLRDIDIDITLRDGNLTVRQFRATATEGQIIAQFHAEAGSEGIATRGMLEGIDIVLGTGKESEKEFSIPQQNFRLEFETAGATTRELAANLNGHAQLIGGAGRLKNSFALGLYGNFLTELLSSVNPFVTREPYTTITCFAAFAEIVDGVAEIKPGAVMQTDKLNMFAYGQVDLKTEQVNMRFDTGARSGIGISVSDFVNPFVGVSGTLANPGLGVDPKNAMFEGGFAYATVGLSIIAKGLFNRWFGASDPCAKLVKEAEINLQKRQLAPQPQPPVAE